MNVCCCVPTSNLCMYPFKVGGTSLQKERERICMPMKEQFLFPFSYFLKRRTREQENCVSLSKKRKREREMKQQLFLSIPIDLGPVFGRVYRAHLLKRKEKKNTGSEQQISAENNSSDFLIIIRDAGLGLASFDLSLSFLKKTARNEIVDNLDFCEKGILHVFVFVVVVVFSSSSTS